MTPQETLKHHVTGAIERGETQAIVEHTQVGLDRFNEELATQYTNLFANDPEYTYSAARITPGDLARKMTLGLASGSANKDGDGIKRTCKKLGIAHTYKAIRAYLNGA